jgi:hypothetical protein
MARRRVDFVGVNVFGERLVDRLIEAGEELSQSLTPAAYQHGQGAIFVAGRGDTTNWAEHADGDVPVGNQLRDVGQGCGNQGGVLLGSRRVYAAGSLTSGRLAAMFQGSNSSMRVMGWSAMHVSTSRR